MGKNGGQASKKERGNNYVRFKWGRARVVVSELPTSKSHIRNAYGHSFEQHTSCLERHGILIEQWAADSVSFKFRYIYPWLKSKLGLFMTMNQTASGLSVYLNITFYSLLFVYDFKVLPR